MTRAPFHWVLILVLSTLWASAFAMTKVAVEGLPAGFIVTARLGLAAVLLAGVMVWQGERLPAWSNRPAWRSILAMGTIGTAAPFFLFTVAQKDIDSALAALLIAATPLYTVIIAHFRFSDERLNWAKLSGILVGFAGVAVLLGPDALAGFGQSHVIAQALVLLGALCYAINTIIARGAAHVSPTVLPVGFLSVAAIASLPLALTADYDALTASPVHILMVIGLAALPTAAAGWLLMYLIARTSATFISISGYIIPIVAAVIGAVTLGETLKPNMAIALGLILGGVWLSQRQPNTALPSTTDRQRSRESQ